MLMRDKLGSEPLDMLHAWDAGKVSAEAMARLLYIETGVSVTGATVRRWLRAGVTS